MKDIMLKITGKMSAQSDVIEFITEGKMSRNGTTTVVKYCESPISGMEGCTSFLTITPGKLKMKRTGEAYPTPTVLEFEKGKRFSGIYETPAGPLIVELVTDNIDDLSEKDDGSSAMSIDYSLSIRGLTDSRNTLDIEIRDKEAMYEQ